MSNSQMLNVFSFIIYLNIAITFYYPIINKNGTRLIINGADIFKHVVFVFEWLKDKSINLV